MEYIKLIRHPYTEIISCGILWEVNPNCLEMESERIDH